MKKKTDTELMAQAKELFSSIYEVDCFGIKDLVRYELVCRELERRGYEVDETKKLEIRSPYPF